MKEAANRGGGRSRSRLLLRCQILWSRLAELAVLEGFHGWRFDEHGRACIVVAPGERIVRSRCGRQRREEQREREDGVHLSPPTLPEALCTNRGTSEIQKESSEEGKGPAPIRRTARPAS